MDIKQCCLIEVAVSRDERTMYTSSRDGNVRLREIETGVKGTLMLHAGYRITHTIQVDLHAYNFEMNRAGISKSPESTFKQ